MWAISVIVPVFNTERYLERCLESIVNQTLRDIEIILVNDGSTDRSGEICRSYAEHDARVRVIEQNNRGLAAARNSGLKVARGDFIGFVDSDDWIEPDMFERMYEVGTQNDCDIVFCNVYRDENVKQRPYLPGGLYERKEIEEKIFPRLLAVCDERSGLNVLRWCNWLRIYRRDLVNEHKIRFDERFRRCQDLPFTFECTLHADRYYYLDQDYLYHNRMNYQSLSKGYTEDMWGLIKPLIVYLYDVAHGYERYDFSEQMALRAFLFALDCAENEAKIDNPHGLLKRLRIIDEIARDDLVREVLPRLNSKLMVLRTRVYFEAFRWRVPLLVYWVALWRHRKLRRQARTSIEVTVSSAERISAEFKESKGRAKVHKSED